MNIHTLITDDDAVSCRLFAKILEGEGYQMDWVQTGEAALTQLLQQSYDLLGWTCACQAWRGLR
jgi:CheY-like chemotaxis protein